MRIVVALLTIALGLGLGGRDGAPLHLTTPRALVGNTDRAVQLGVPGGRAWGIESVLVALPPSSERRAVSATIEVADPSVREAFVRIAYYDRSSGRPRQLAVDDSPLVTSADGARVAVVLDPPAGAIAFRVRILARAARGAAFSDPAAVLIGELSTDRAARARAPVTRLRGGPNEFP